MKKPAAQSLIGPKPIPFDDAEFGHEFPTLNEYMTCEVFDDGEPRTTSTVLFFFEKGQMKACVNDRHFGRTAFVTAATFGEIMLKIESGLADDNLDWRVKKAGPGEKGFTPF